MKRSQWVQVLLIAPLGAAGAEGTRGTGLGVILGEPTGVSVKSWRSDTTAIDLGLSWSFGRNVAALHAHADFLWHDFGVFRSPGKEGEPPVMRWDGLAVYYGVGARIKFEASPLLGLRMPVGVTWLPAGAAWEVFGELVPLVDLFPSTAAGAHAGFGVRLYFP